MIDLRGKPIAITGASSGIGRAAAIACAKAGMPVVAGARREDRLRELVREIERGGGRAISVACDVVNPADCERLIAEGEKAFGSLYSVFANAGYGLEREAAELSDAEFREIFETNFWGTVNTVKPAVLRMLAHAPDAAASRGHVLICTSAMSKIALPCFAAYSTTKAAQDHYGRALRLELADRGIHVSTVHPISTVSEFSQRTTEHSGGSRLWHMAQGTKQTAEHVADRIVACLRRPKGEVWPHLPTRLILGLATAFPALADRGLSRELMRRRRNQPR